jgi:hypothetical protein
VTLVAVATGALGSGRAVFSGEFIKRPLRLGMRSLFRAKRALGCVVRACSRAIRATTKCSSCTPAAEWGARAGYRAHLLSV